MTREVEVSDEFRDWYEDLDLEEQASVIYSVEILRNGGRTWAGRTSIQSGDHGTAI
ncbi:MAG TPA: hypothetical protein VHZ09_18055 [Acidobacteriaceae bacterium]|jgi:hypothetical protein|nr:hypothetical protein [Acidobacteriaceae bacterium]